MDVFQDYAKYYDLLYADKDYQGEANFVSSLLKSYGNHPKTLLELGAGTGKHALLLAQQGFEIVAVDQSATMLEMAGRLLQNAPQGENVRLEKGDVRYFETPKQFDAVISLFHVISYQISEQDLKSTFLTVKKHLKPGGIFIFDCWYGPAVLSEKPSVRYKVFKNDNLQIERVAVPTMDVNANTVKVDYHLYIKEKDKPYRKTNESHLMRYLFLPEIIQLCKEQGMTLLDRFEWMTKAPLSDKSWGACFVVRL